MESVPQKGLMVSSHAKVDIIECNSWKMEFGI